MAKHTSKKSTTTPGKKRPAKASPEPKNTAGSATTPSPPTGPVASGAANRKVRVRMFRQGLGDCFLVTFDLGGDEKHMLIDCGTLGATTTGVSLADVFAEIDRTTKRHLHLLIATHEHWDHVRGFRDFQKELAGWPIDHVWMAWTENPIDPEAQKIAKNKQDLGSALAMASDALSSATSTPASQALGVAVHDLLGFVGVDGPLAAAKFSEQVNEAMDVVRKGLPKAKTEFHGPGDPVIEPDWLPGFRFYILGPPKDLGALNDTGEHGSSELYGLARAMLAGAQFQTSGMGLAQYLANKTNSPESAEFELQMPFDSRFRYAMADQKKCDELYRSYSPKSEEWRRVDYDWLHAASDMALQLDSATNNTSLAMAIERISDGKVLLFPADAQEGNWLSWHVDGDKTRKWTSKDTSGKSVDITAADLLNRTVFYKVGHHSSHNATARAKGLELMQQQDELVAFIPVDRAVALKRNPKNSWKMPAVELYRHLLEKTQGRVVRSDTGWADDARNAQDKETEQEFLNLATDAEWAAWKKSQLAAQQNKTVDIQPNFVDFVLD